MADGDKPTVNPGALAGVEAAELSTPGASPAGQPRDIGALAADMPPVAAAGLGLAGRVLTIAGWSIAGLFAYLVYMDVTIGADLRRTYGAIDTVEAGTVARFEQFEADLGAALTDASAWTPEAHANAAEVIALLERTPGLGARARAEVAACAPYEGEAQARAATMQTCLARLGQIRRENARAAQNSALLEAAGQSATKLNEQRSAFHAFWLQAGQLILLNLLLPLMTALLGYIFGTQQANQNRN